MGGLTFFTGGGVVLEGDGATGSDGDVGGDGNCGRGGLICFTGGGSFFTGGGVLLLEGGDAEGADGDNGGGSGGFVTCEGGFLIACGGGFLTGDGEVALEGDGVLALDGDGEEMGKRLGGKGGNGGQTLLEEDMPMTIRTRNNCCVAIVHTLPRSC